MLILPAILWREIEERTRLASPDEACGLLLGKRRAGSVHVAALAYARNVARTPRTRFELDPLDVLAAEDGARAAGLVLVGAWHSHPRGPLAPSSADRAGAAEGWLTVIAAPRGEAGIELSCWRATATGLEVVAIGQPLTARS